MSQGPRNVCVWGNAEYMYVYLALPLYKHIFLGTLTNIYI